MNQKTIIAILGTVVIVLLGTTVYFATLNKSNESIASAPKVVQQPAPTPATQQQSAVQPSTPAQVNETANWKVFRSKQEGFTLKYPNDWKLQDGDNIDCGVTGAGCPRRVTFTSPDGIMVRYVQYDDTTTDKLTCVQAPCTGIKVFKIEKLNIPNFGQALLVRTDKGISLDQPLSEETTPTVGENMHKGFDINLTMPSKNGKRYSMFLYMNYANDGTTKFDKLTNDEFFNLDSVKKAETIMKSIEY